MTEVQVSNVETDKAPEKVITRGVRGTVKWFSLYNHYGFINRADNGEDVFVHLSGIIQRGKIRFALDAEQEVEMDVASGFKGEKAIAVTSPGGFPIENTRIVRFNRRLGVRRTKSKNEEVETADEGEQPNQDGDKRQAADEKKSEGGEKGQKKRFNHRRRASITNEDESDQAEGDAKKDDLDKPKADKSKPDEQKKDNLEKPKAEASKADKPKPDEQKKVDAKKDSVPSDKQKELKPAAVKDVNESGDKAAPLDKSKKPEESKPVATKKVNESGDKAAAKPEDNKRASFGGSLVGGVKKMFEKANGGDATSKTTAAKAEDK